MVGLCQTKLYLVDFYLKENRHAKTIKHDELIDVKLQLVIDP